MFRMLAWNWSIILLYLFINLVVAIRHPALSANTTAQELKDV